MRRHALDTALLQSICAGCVLTPTSLQCAERRCKPQSVESRRPPQLPFICALLHKQSASQAVSFVLFVTVFSLFCCRFKKKNLRLKANMAHVFLFRTRGKRRQKCTSGADVAKLWIGRNAAVTFGLDKAPD